MRVDSFGSSRAQGAMIERLTSDSRRCAPGVAFFAYPGETADGRALYRAGDRARRRGGASGRARASPGTTRWQRAERAGATS